MKTRLLILISCAIALHAQAGSATWNLNPVTNDWNTAANWLPATVPNGPGDTATFALSNQSALSNSADTLVNGLVFNAGATAYTTSVIPRSTFTIGAGGIVNSSGATQTFVNQVNAQLRFGTLVFADGASIGEMITIVNKGASGNGDGAQISFLGNSSAGHATLINELPTGDAGGKIDFFDTSSAADATFVDQGGAYQRFGGRVNFHDNSTAGRAHFDVQSGPDAQHSPGLMDFMDNSTADHGTFDVGGGRESTTGGGRISLSGGATGGNGIFTINGGTAGGLVPAMGGTLSFYLDSNVGHATCIANGATAEGAGGGTVDSIFGGGPGTGATFIANGATVNGAQGGVIYPGDLTVDTVVVANDGANGGLGGRVYFAFGNIGGPGRVKVYGDGRVDISSIYGTSSLVLGSIEGTGKIFLGGRNLSVGSNNRSTRFAGVFRDGGYNGGTGGSLTKVGTGKLVLLQPSTYTGATVVMDGVLLVKNRTGSATGTGAVTVNAGTLGGKGIIAGAVTVGTDAGPGAVLLPDAKQVSDILTMQKNLTFHQDGTYHCDLNSGAGTIGRVAANGVTLGAGQFAISDLGNTALPSGSVLTVIANTAATPISGTFANLADGSTFTLGSNTFQASYSGGDGNDLTLTVLP